MMSLLRLQRANPCFWTKHPALLLGLCLWMASSIALFLPYKAVFSLLTLLYLFFFRKPLFSIPFLLLFFYAVTCLDSPKPQENIKALFAIHSKTKNQTLFGGKKFRYQGTLYLKEKKLPCTLYCSQKKPLSGNKLYALEGKFIQPNPYTHLFFAKKATPQQNRFSLSEIRFQAKEKIRSFLKKHFSLNLAILLGALLTADVEYASLRFDYAKLGMQHVLAVSGFHFGIFALLLSYLLSIWIPSSHRTTFLSVFLLFYFLFIGSMPAVQRSFIAAELYLLSHVFLRKATPLNLLGAAMSIELLFSPWMAGNVGFQLSYLSCLGILLFFPLFKTRLLSFLPKRSQEERKSFCLQDKHLYLILALFKTPLALMLSVNIVLFPLLLYHFHSFPLLSLVYNLFFPPLIALLIFTFALDLLIFLILPIYPLSLTQFLGSFLCTLTSYPPHLLDVSLFYSTLSSTIVSIYLALLLSLGIYYYEQKDPSTKKICFS